MAEVLIVHSSDEMYGSDRMVLACASALMGRGDTDVRVWLPDDLSAGPGPLSRELTGLGIPVEHLGLPVLRRANLDAAGVRRLLGSVVRLSRALRSRPVSGVYCTTSAVLPVALAARLAGVRRVLLHLQEIWSGGERTVLGPLALLCDRIVAISEAAGSSLPRYLRGRTRVVPNCVYPPPGGAAAGRPGGSSRRDPARPIEYLVASRWNGWKGHGTLLRAWDGCAAPPGRLTVLGGPPGSGTRFDVPAAVGGMRRGDSVRVVGEVPDIAPYVRESDVVIVPSDRPEPFGLVAIEAFAAGVPVIGSNGGGLAQAVVDGENGWLFEIGDPESLRVVLERLSREDVAAASRAARECYLRQYSLASYHERFLAAIGDVM